MTAPIDISSFRRPPAEVMGLKQIGSIYPTRLSFMRVLLRTAISRGWVFEPAQTDWDEHGFGRAIYRVRDGGRIYCLVAFTQYLDPALRNDRVIAEAWDAAFVLFDGEPSEADLERLAASVPLQEAGRFTASELVLSRANKSVRIFEHAVERLSRGEQPDLGFLLRTGYLMRTTAVYGNGKFGVADRAKVERRPGMMAPFQVEFLTVLLIRQFTVDLAEHVARARGGDRAVGFDPEARRFIGIGNSTGLGMAPFLFNHPALISRWFMARETALARVRAAGDQSEETLLRFRKLLERTCRHFDQWIVDDVAQTAKIAQVKSELSQLADWLDTEDRGGRPLLWNEISEHAEQAFSLDGRQVVFSLVIEPQGALVDDLAEAMSLERAPKLDPSMRVSVLKDILQRDYAWALSVDLDDPAVRAKFWYVSEEKREPRLGDRHHEAGSEKEMPFDIVVTAQSLSRALKQEDEGADIGLLLMERPDLIHVVSRIQTGAVEAYAEIRDNLIGADCLPLDMLRCKLAFFGALKYDPLSDRWLRITLFQGAPHPDELTADNADDWLFPYLGGV